MFGDQEVASICADLETLALEVILRYPQEGLAPSPTVGSASGVGADDVDGELDPVVDNLAGHNMR